jgi:hypothetical protein
LALRQKSFRSGLGFIWASIENSNDFAIPQSADLTKIYHSIKKIRKS